MFEMGIVVIFSLATTAAIESKLYNPKKLIFYSENLQHIYQERLTQFLVTSVLMKKFLL
jgi:hypothetical protein